MRVSLPSTTIPKENFSLFLRKPKHRPHRSVPEGIPLPVGVPLHLERPVKYSNPLKF